MTTPNSFTRRNFIRTAALAAGTVTILPFAGRAAFAGGHSASDVLETPVGKITVHPVSHASFVLETPAGTIYSDPVGDAAAYANMPRPDLVTITHEHGDHFNVDTLNALVQDGTEIVTNPAVFEKLPENLKSKARAVANGESTAFKSVKIDAIPAHNLTEERMKFHPPGRDNGYVMTFGEGDAGYRVYISGDTEDVPEMRALENIDLAFVCMNLPFTMTAETAADAVNAFKPKLVYPYHYRGRDGGTQDPDVFAAAVSGSQVKMGQWYPES